MNEKDGIAP